MTTNIQEASGVQAKLRAIIATRVKYAEENRDFLKIYLTEFVNVTHPASINKEFRDKQFKLAQGIEQVLREGVKAGEIQELDIEAVAFTIQDTVRSLTTRRILGWSKKDLEEDIDILCNFVWNGIGCS